MATKASTPWLRCPVCTPPWHGQHAQPRDPIAVVLPPHCPCTTWKLYLAGPGLQLDDHVAQPFGQPHRATRRQGAMPPATGTSVPQPRLLPCRRPHAAARRRRRTAAARSRSPPLRRHTRLLRRRTPPAPGRARTRTRRSLRACIRCTCYVHVMCMGCAWGVHGGACDMCM